MDDLHRVSKGGRVLAASLVAAAALTSIACANGTQLARRPNQDGGAPGDAWQGLHDAGASDAWTAAPLDAGAIADAYHPDAPRCVEGAYTSCTASCGSTGLAECIGGELGACVPPATEICDGRDQDCDGAIDEGIASHACAMTCGGGSTSCIAGAFTSCMGGTPTIEACNHLDDDCDGRIDEMVTQTCSTACGAGVQMCASGSWGACSAPSPSAEICDGRDQDCDGRIDEGTFTSYVAVAGGTNWRTNELSCAGAMSPTTTLQSVFDIETPGHAYFLTASTFHVLDLATSTWIQSGARTTIMPELGTATVIAAFTVPPRPTYTVEDLYVITSASQIFGYNIETQAASPVFTLAHFNDGGPNPRAFTPEPGLQSAYMDLGGTWSVDPRPVCTAATSDHGPYMAYVTSDHLVFDDAGWCFSEIGDVPIATHAPFSFTGAPARSAWRHTFFHGGLWLVAAPHYH